MRVGVSLLTLVPGISGGSETYVRELVRALGRVGRFEYRVFVPSIAAGIVDADSRSEELREKGLARAAAFTWIETARRHEDVYIAAAAVA